MPLHEVLDPRSSAGPTSIACAVLRYDRSVRTTDGPAATIGAILSLDRKRTRDRLVPAGGAARMHDRAALTECLYRRHAPFERRVA